MSRKNEKRDRLVEAANELIYQQTFNSTTLADIASKAEVPLGNVYYYFKTKDDILKAVVQKREAELSAVFNACDQLPDGKDRLRSFITRNTVDSETIARFGCTLGSLCQELGKQGGDIANSAAILMTKTLQWVEKQFQSMGKGEQAVTFAEHLITSLQGVSLLTLTFKDPTFLQRQGDNLEQWLETA
jgi:TetR/AcrR family transcriptional repressor of nem operon